MSGATIVVTVGHSNVPFAAFLALVRSASVEAICDVRSAPYSKYTPHFTRASLEPAVRAAGIRYVFLGDALGGKPSAPELYDEDDGRVRYDRIAALPAFDRGIARVIDGAARIRVALLCAEEDPTGCHRRRLVGRALIARGLEIVHLRGDGRLEAEADVEARATASPPQLTLFAREPERLPR